MKQLTQLEKLLYRKNSCEQLMSVWNIGIRAYSVFIDENKRILRDETLDEYEKSKYQIAIYDNEIKLNNFITQYKLTKRELNHFILPKIEEVATKKEKKDISFDKFSSDHELIDNEYFTKCKQQPANVELCEVNKLLSDHVDVLENLRGEIVELLESKKHLKGYELAKMHKELFDVELNLISNKKRLVDRVDYYNNQFLPKFNSDMKEAKKLMPKYLAKAKKIVDLNIDFKLKMLLEEYEGHKNDEEQTWLFYTALRARVLSIQKELKENTILVESGDKKIKEIVESI